MIKATPGAVKIIDCINKGFVSLKSSRLLDQMIFEMYSGPLPNDLDGGPTGTLLATTPIDFSTLTDEEGCNFATTERFRVQMIREGYLGYFLLRKKYEHKVCGEDEVIRFYGAIGCAGCDLNVPNLYVTPSVSLLIDGINISFSLFSRDEEEVRSTEKENKVTLIKVVSDFLNRILNRTR